MPQVVAGLGTVYLKTEFDTESQKRKQAESERDAAIQQRDSAQADQAVAESQRNQMQTQRDAAQQDRNTAMAKQKQAEQQRDTAQAQLQAEHQSQPQQPQPDPAREIRELCRRNGLKRCWQGADGRCHFDAAYAATLAQDSLTLIEA